MNRINVMGLLFFFTLVYSDAIGTEVIFIGLKGDGAPAIEKTYDKMLRERLSTSPYFRVADYQTIQNYKERIRFHDYPTVSQDLLNTLRRFASDSTIFIWGSVREYNMRPVRRNLIGSYIEADLVLNLTIYSLSNQRFAFSGNVKASSERYKGISVFRPVETVVHISSQDRIDLLDELVSRAVMESERIVSVVMRSDPESLESMATEASGQYLPSLYDVFSIPSMEASEIQDSYEMPENP
ncbi:hypothetical protein CHISP_2129 [Chitinispirillum alkaliphilum]|nr:hypothetical protein CHISP_2129 [Chitinispirillum alkaliphilum]